MSEQRSSVEKLTALLQQWYTPLRQRLQGSTCGVPVQVKEHIHAGGGCQFGERFLQILWNERRYHEPLQTRDGRRVTVVTPGTWNVESGPDFRQAVVTFDGHTCCGDVEIHRHEADWERHGHHRDGRYAEVVLHVVWSGARNAAAQRPPCVLLSEFVEGSWRTLMEALEAAFYPYSRQVCPGACAVRWALSGDGAVQRLLDVAGLARFEAKSTRLWRRAVAVGAEQALYEAVFDCLGYKANRRAFQLLAQAVPLRQICQAPDALQREALLFGSAGLLPDPSLVPVLPRWRERLAQLWDYWWTFGRPPAGLPWRRSGSRPLNSPERRLAAGLAWLEQTGCRPAAWLCTLADSARSPRELLQGVHRALAVTSPWEDCKDFAVTLAKPAALLGSARINDMLANVFLPFAAAAAADTNSESAATHAREAFLLLPALQENRLLREATHRFLVPPSRARPLLRQASSQQGLLEIYQTFCLALNGDCSSCPFTMPETG